MTHDERIAALKVRGYTPRQAAFLTLVLLHSGHFLRRHYAAFRGVVDGARTTDFVQRLLTRGLAARSVYWRHTHVYHVSAPSLYAAIGQPNSRHRRPVEPDMLTQKLMTLDVIIAHRTRPCLATEADKVRYFTETFRVPLQDLPCRIYRSEHPGVAETTRYFVDRVPVLLGDRITFVYVPGWAPVDGFVTFLREYAPLFEHLPHVRILFCTADQDAAESAHRLCERRLPSVAADRRTSTARALVLAHFRERRRFDARDFRTFTPSDLEQFRKDQQRYGGPSYDEWYRRWCQEGDVARGVGADITDPLDAGIRVRFDVFPIPFEYPLLGRVRKAA